MIAAALGRVVLAAALTLLYIAVNLRFSGLAERGILLALVRLAILAAISYGLWHAVSGTCPLRRQRLGAWLVVVIALVLWQSVMWWLAASGTFRPDIGNPQLLSVAIALPLLIGLPLLLWSRQVGAWLDHIPANWLVGLQVYRVFGSVLLISWATASVPGVIALPAGLGDVLVGLLALPAALAVQAGGRRGRAWGTAWNVLGILDHVTAVSINLVLSSASSIGFYPLVLTPALSVPLSILLHALSLRQLRRQSRTAELALARECV